MRTLYLQLTRYQHNDPWGFKLHGGIDFNSSIEICNVDYGGQAHKAGMEVGDKVIGIGSEPTSYMTHQMAQQAIARCGNDLHMQISRQDCGGYSNCGGSSFSPPAQNCSYSSPSYCASASREHNFYSGGSLPRDGGFNNNCGGSNRYTSQTQVYISDNMGGRQPANSYNSFNSGSPQGRSFVPPQVTFPASQPQNYSSPPSRQPTYQSPPSRQPAYQAPIQPPRQQPLSFNQPTPKSSFTPMRANPPPPSKPINQMVPFNVTPKPFGSSGPSPFSNPTRPYGSDLPPPTQPYTPPPSHLQPQKAAPPSMAFKPAPRGGVPVLPRPALKGPGGSGYKGKPRRVKIGEAIRHTEAASGTAPICHSCKIKIRGPFMASLDYCFCPDHFLCIKCNRNLEECGFVENDGALHCEECYARYLAPTCNKCAQIIMEEVVHAMDKTFHPGCFICVKCNKQLSGGDGTFRIGDDSMVYCEEDWMEEYETRCDKCHKAIEAIDKVIEIGGQTLHSRCFCCSACQVSLDGKKFVSKNGKPFCKAHANAGALF